MKKVADGALLGNPNRDRIRTNLDTSRSAKTLENKGKSVSVNTPRSASHAPRKKSDRSPSADRCKVADHAKGDDGRASGGVEAPSFRASRSAANPPIGSGGRDGAARAGNRDARARAPGGRACPSGDRFASAHTGRRLPSLWVVLFSGDTGRDVSAMLRASRGVS